MNPTVSELLDLFIDGNDQRVVLVDLNNDATEIFDGTLAEMSDEYQELEVQSIDNIYDDPSCHGKLVINVDTSEMG